MRRLFAFSLFVMLFSVPIQAFASPAQFFSFDPTGDVFDCSGGGGNIYSVVSGTVNVVVHEEESSSGSTSFTITFTPKQVVLEDGDGNEYKLRGAVWGGFTSNGSTGAEQGTFTAKLQIVSAGGGGTADSVNLVGHLSPNGNFTEFDFGTCAF